MTQPVDSLVREFDTRPLIKTQEEALEIQKGLPPRPKSDRKVVCIVGCAAFSRTMAEQMDPSVHIWSLNEAWMFLRCRVDAWFQIHDEVSWTKALTYMSGLEVPVYLQQADPRVPHSVEYPLDEITRKHRRFLTSSTAFMIALAILQGFDEIRLIGNDMDRWSEYSDQRPGVLYWIGVADGLGIKVWLPPDCPLFNDVLYGYENPSMVPRELLYQFHSRSAKVYDNARVEARGARRYREGVEMAGGTGQVLEDALAVEQELLLQLNAAVGALKIVEVIINNSGAGRAIIPHIDVVEIEDIDENEARHRR